jgi:hypothetical protein
MSAANHTDLLATLMQALGRNTPEADSLFAAMKERDDASDDDSAAADANDNADDEEEEFGEFAFRGEYQAHVARLSDGREFVDSVTLLCAADDFFNAETLELDVIELPIAFEINTHGFEDYTLDEEVHPYLTYRVTVHPSCSRYFRIVPMRRELHRRTVVKVFAERKDNFHRFQRGDPLVEVEFTLKYMVLQHIPIREAEAAEVAEVAEVAVSKL